MSKQYNKINNMKNKSRNLIPFLNNNPGEDISNVIDMNNHQQFQNISDQQYSNNNLSLNNIMSGSDLYGSGNNLQQD